MAGRPGPQPATVAQLQALLGTFADQYNHRRPHRSLAHQATPAPLTPPGPTAVPRDQPAYAHYRVRRDVIAESGTVTLRTGGKLHHIGIGRIHTGTAVLVLVQDLHVPVINAAPANSSAN